MYVYEWFGNLKIPSLAPRDHNTERAALCNGNQFSERLEITYMFLCITYFLAPYSSLITWIGFVPLRPASCFFAFCSDGQKRNSCQRNDRDNAKSKQFNQQK